MQDFESFSPEIGPLLESLKEQHSALIDLVALSKIVETQPEILSDKNFLQTLLEIAQTQEPSIIKKIAGFTRGHIRLAEAHKKTARNLLKTLMNRNPLEDTEYKAAYSGNDHITEEEKVAFYILGRTFLGNDRLKNPQNLRADWQNAVQESIAETYGISNDDLKILADWYVKLARKCKHTLSAEQKLEIYDNLARINHIFISRGQSNASIHIPNYLFEDLDIPKEHPAIQTL